MQADHLTTGKFDITHGDTTYNCTAIPHTDGEELYYVVEAVIKGGGGVTAHMHYNPGTGHFHIKDQLTAIALKEIEEEISCAIQRIEA